MSTTTGTGRTIERELTVPVGQADAYATVGTPEGWRRWLIEEGEIETLPDGRLHLKWDMGASVQIEILDSVLNESIKTEWYAPSEPGRTTVTFRVTPAPDGTRIALTETGFGGGDDWDRCYDATNEVWDFALGRLAHALG